jgi:hypothetical protein
MIAPIRLPRIVVFITASAFSFLELLKGASCLEYLGLNWWETRAYISAEKKQNLTNHSTSGRKFQLKLRLRNNITVYYKK